MKKILKMLAGIVACFSVMFTTACGKNDDANNEEVNACSTDNITLEQLNEMLNDEQKMNMNFANTVAIIPFDHINGPRDEWSFYALVNFQYAESRYVKYQVTYLSCTCRSANVNYWQTAYIEMSTNVSDPENSKLRNLSFDIDGTQHYTAGFWGDSNPIKSGDTIIATYDDYIATNEELTKVTIGGRVYTIRMSEGVPTFLVSGDTEIEVESNKVTVGGVEYTLSVSEGKVTSLSDGTNTINTVTKHAGVYIEDKEGVEDGWYYPTIENEFIKDLLIGKTKKQIDQYSVMDDMVSKGAMSEDLYDAFTGASVSTNNIIRIVKAVFDYHAKTASFNK